jgi:tetratricopeptide (TPR) repeat protein
MVKKKQGQFEAALPWLNQALEFYYQRFGKQDHSLIAKTYSGIGDTHKQLGQIDLAEKALKESLRLFEVTCGDSPLTANALYNLAKVEVILNKLSEAKKHFDASLKYHVRFDTLDMPQIIKLLNKLMNLNIQICKNGNINEIFTVYVEDIAACHKSMIEQKLDEDDNAAVFYKTAAEFLLVGGEYELAIPHLMKSINLLSKVTTIDCSGLIATCQQLLAIAVGNRQKSYRKDSASKASAKSSPK